MSFNKTPRSPNARPPLLPALCAGLGAGTLFFLSLGLQQQGALLIFFALLPLMLWGLGFGVRQAGIACIAACVAVAVFTGFGGAVFFTGFFALPAFYFMQRALLWREGEHGREWYPMLKILSDLTIMAAAIFMFLALATSDQGGLKSLVPQSLTENFKGADPELAATAKLLAGEWSFILFALVGWLWISMLYGQAVLANVLLKVQNHALRESYGIEPRGLPYWLLLLLALSGLIVMIGQGMDRYVAQAVFLLLLLPYFLCGLAFIHVQSIEHRMPMRRLWITCFYIVFFVLATHSYLPPLAIIAIGLYRQLAEMLDRGRGMG